MKGLIELKVRYPCLMSVGELWDDSEHVNALVVSWAGSGAGSDGGSHHGCEDQCQGMG